MDKAIAYTRVSSDEQRKEGYSLDYQTKTIKEYARKNNLNIVEFFSESMSAKLPGRIEFNKMLKYAQINKIDNILFFNESTFPLYFAINFGSFTNLSYMALKKPPSLHAGSRNFVSSFHISDGSSSNILATILGGVVIFGIRVVPLSKSTGISDFALAISLMFCVKTASVFSLNMVNCK